MDRFIDDWLEFGFDTICNLKSNMDRFIVLNMLTLMKFFFNLKSNMDRFIG